MTTIVRTQPLTYLMPKQIFCYRKDGALQTINLDEIVVMETADNYLKFFMHKEIIVVRTSLEAALNQLPADRFIQIHRSYAVAIDQINKIEKDSLTLRISPETILPVSRTGYAALMERIQIIETGAGDAGG
jgi:DNA-binding LytR/AlgR family response regulator